jgi:hypothetical protein
VIDVLFSNGATEVELARIVEDLEGTSALARFYYHLLIFAEYRMLSYGISCGNRRLATLITTSMYFRFSPAPVDSESMYNLSSLC